MRKNILINGIILVIVLVLVWLVLAWGASAAEGFPPEGVEIFQIPNQGLTCVVWPDGSGDCYCDCETCFDEEVVSFAETPDVPDATSVPTDRPTDSPTGEPTPNPTSRPTDPPDPEDGRCNRGLGNGSEECDPGNSGGRPGRAGEGDG